MTPFFKTFTASLLAILVAGFIFIFGSIITISVMVASSNDVVEVDGSILSITLEETITDKPTETPISLSSLMSLDFEQKYLTTLDILSAIEKAKFDERIKGIYISPSINMSLGTAQLEEIRSAIAAFKASGKFVISYASTYDQAAYYLASIADKVYLHPEGYVMWKGLSSEVMFFKGTLEKLGITPKIVRHGSFKSAIEPYTNDKMSDNNREQIESLLGSVWGNIVSNIAKDRSMDSLKIEKAASDLSMPLAIDAKEAGFVDELLYRDQVQDMLSELTSEEKPKMIPLANYITTGVDIFSGDPYSDNKIALIYAEGDIVDGKGDNSSIGGDRLAAQVAKVRKDSGVKALVLRVNSPGGSSLASDIIWREVALTQKEKPVIVSMGDYAASGGYYISAPADLIVASPATITGSIGVFAISMDASKGAKEKLGISVESVSTNDNGTFMSIFSPMNNTQKRYLERSIEQVYTTFTGHVAEGRNLSIERVDEISQGRVWSGAQAVNNGLIDGYATLREAILLAADRAGVANDFRVVDYKEPSSLFNEVVSSISSSGSEVISSELMELSARLKRLAESSKVQTLLPYTIYFK